ncbi:hypothetical protein [Metabacillus endolithicus]
MIIYFCIVIRTSNKKQFGSKFANAWRQLCSEHFLYQDKHPIE